MQGIGGLGHLGDPVRRQMGFRTVAISRGADKEELARELGAHEYVDTQKVPAAEGLQKLGGADLVLATAPHAEAIAARARRPQAARQAADRRGAVRADAGLGVRAALSGKTHRRLAERQRDRLRGDDGFSALANVRPRIEVFKLEQAEQAFAKVMENRVRFRAVLTP